MKLPSLKIGKIESRFPVIQAGMGVRIGNSTLASAVARLGGFGTIASVGLGDIEKSKTDFINESNRVLREEIIRAKKTKQRPWTNWSKYHGSSLKLP